MQKRWILTPAKPDLVNSISQDHQLNPVVSQILLNRKITSPEQITRYLQPSLAHLPDPKEMMGMDRAVHRLVEAVQKKEPITVYGDYDVDGTTATALLMDFFQSLGARIDYYIPHRVREGYSLNQGALRKIGERGTKVLITVDNGISAHAEASFAKSLGMDLIITDHHEVPETLPEAYAILNPKQAGDTFPGKELAGVGVAFYLIVGLRKELRDRSLLPDVEPNLRRALDLVAVGTIADMAPLTGINRILVREGLKVLSHTQRAGLKALKQVSAVEEEVRADQVAFRIGPRINAVGRLEDASLGVNLLLCEDEKLSLQIAQQLNSANEARKTIEDEISLEAVAFIEREKLTEKYRSLVVYHQAWHPGVVGIVASRLVEKYYRPSIVLTQEKGKYKGSARSISNFNMVEALRNCADLLDRFGGHSYAAGLTMPVENLHPFIERFDEITRSRLKEEDFQPTLKVDVESDPGSIDPKLLEQLARLEPFGLGNPAPVLLLRGAQVRESRVVGEKHLRLKVGDSKLRLGAIGFRLADKIPPVDSQVDLVFYPEWNEWNGNKNIQLRLIDLQKTPN